MTPIYRDTKISQIIKANANSIEAIAAVAKPLEKLRNPLLRKMLAGRTTLAQAARVGGCGINELAEALKPLGFDFVNEEEHQQGTGKKRMDEKGAFASGQIQAGSRHRYPETVLDVREDLASGKDPLKKIMSAVNDLPAGHVLHLINSFEPTPLISLLAKKGFESRVEQRGPDEVHAFFRLRPREQASAGNLEEEAPEFADEKTFTARLAAFGTKVVPVDVSGMEMPMPMVTILEALSTMPADHVLSVTHKRVPVFLFSELKERQFSYMVYKAGDTDIRLLIYK